MVAMWRTRGGSATALAVLGMMLAACSSGGSEETPVPDVTPAERYNALMDQGVGIIDEMYYEVYSDPAALPTEGSASYSGVIALDTNGWVDDGVADNADLVGDLALTMDLDHSSDPISGEATNFVSSTSDEYTGRLVVTGSTLSRDADVVTEAPINFALDGTLTAPEGDDLGVVLDAAGTFSGDSIDEFDHAFGTVYGTGCGDMSCTDIEGEFVTRRVD